MQTRTLSIALALLLPSQAALAQVLITEIQPNPGTGLANAEFVEIHNTGAAAVDISDWGLSDFSGANAGRRYTFPAATSIAPGQVIIVARQGAAYAANAVTNGWVATVANFEFANGADDATVTNMGGSGGNAFALNDTDDGVVLDSAPGIVVSGIDFGATDRPEVPGAQAGTSGAGLSLVRVANTGASITDFSAGTSSPGVGFTGPVPTPPSITQPTRAGANFAFAETVTFGATITDPDGVGAAEYNIAIATSSAGTAATVYAPLAAANVPGGNVWAASGVVQSLVTPLLVFTEPVTFHERYVRWWVYALDNLATDASLPANATTAANNTAYFWENVLPTTTVYTIAEARAQGANERPLWEHHSVRVEGIALTTQEAFATGRTNFFISSPTSVDAIRVFDDVLHPQTINPGDIVRVTGKIGVFGGLRQIGRREPQVDPMVVGSEISLTIVGTGVPPVRTLAIGPMIAAGETNESQLVEITNALFVVGPGGEPMPGATFAGNTTYFVSDGTGTIAVRINNNTNLVGATAPVGAFTLSGILTQFSGGYQVQPRSTADIGGTVPPLDGGINPDTGLPGDGGNDPDSTVPPVDGGDPDTGVPSDAGDSGVPPADTGVDSGVPPADTGVPPADTGVPPADTGVTPADSGVTGDAGIRPDTGVFGTGKNDEDESGCGCTTGRPADAAPWALFLAGGFVFLRRRR